jgi:hypothetical protein
MILHGVITCILMYVIWSWKPAPPNKRSMTTEDQLALKTSAIELKM